MSMIRLPDAFKKRPVCYGTLPAGRSLTFPEDPNNPPELLQSPPSPQGMPSSALSAPFKISNCPYSTGFPAKGYKSDQVFILNIPLIILLEP